MNNINQFLSEFRNGFQRPARYIAQVLFQNGLDTRIRADAAQSNSSGNFLQVLRWLREGWLIESTRTPARGFGTTDLSMYGYTEHFPYHTEFEPLECTFLTPLVGTPGAAGDNPIPRFFSYWQNQIQRFTTGPDSGLDFRFPSVYYATIILTMMDMQNRGTSSWKMVNAYPSVVGSMPVAWLTNDAFMTLPVTFTYSYWTAVPVPDIFDMPTEDNESALFTVSNPRLKIALNFGRPLF